MVRSVPIRTLERWLKTASGRKKLVKRLSKLGKEEARITKAKKKLDRRLKKVRKEINKMTKRRPL